jgi:hypothetical protein
VFGWSHVAKKKTLGGRRRTAPISASRGRPASAFTKPRSGGSRAGAGSRRISKSEQERLTKVLEQRRELAQIVASVFRGARGDKDVKQERMAYCLARSAVAISNMESVRTDFALADAILWTRALDPDFHYLEEIFERLLLLVRQFYERRGS